MKKQIFLGLLFLFFISCNISPQQIEYGTDACHSCNMTIVDQQHASQIVTTKGKAFKFDAIECMFHSLQGEMKDTEMALHLVADFNQPGQLVDATAAFYLVSEQLQSPMGANLSAFQNWDEAQNAKEQFKGNLFSWEEIQNHLTK